MSRTEASLSDEWETPQDLYDSLCYMYGIFPRRDVAANEKNKKCRTYFSKEYSGLDSCWTSDVWCNPPHSLTEKFVRKALREWLSNNINILMIIPANSICTRYAEECIRPHAEFHPIYFRPKFLRDGVPAKDAARNSYFVVIWRKR